LKSSVDEKKILILCPTGLGNIILFLPAYHALKKKFPESEFTIALDSRWCGDEFFSEQFGKEDIFTKFPSNKEGRVRQLKAVIELRKTTFDLTLMPYTLPSLKLAILLLSINSRQKIFFQTKFKWINRRFSICLLSNEGEHYIEKNLLQVRSLGIDVNNPDKWININKTIESNRNELRPFQIGIHPGGNIGFNWARQWPLVHYKKLIEKLLEHKKFRIYVYGGPGEEEIAEDLCQITQGRCIPIINKSLKEVSISIAELNLFVGNDSGLMNMAIGIGIPTLGILGPTNPNHTGPYGSRNRTLRLDIPCSPCYDPGKSLECKYRKCLLELSPEIVEKKIIEMTSHLCKENTKGREQGVSNKYNSDI